MKLIAGLGNPEAKYIKTRHNTGFMVLDRILAAEKITLVEKFRSCFAKKGDILYMLPLTYMNLSGEAIIQAVNFYKLNIEDILVVYDDIALNLGTLRFRAEGSDGGHNGIKSIIKNLNSKNFHRLKIGIGPQPAGIPSEKYVLQEFSISEMQKLEIVLDTAQNAVSDWINTDMQTLQNRYNKTFA